MTLSRLAPAFLVTALLSACDGYVPAYPPEVFETAEAVCTPYAGVRSTSAVQYTGGRWKVTASCQDGTLVEKMTP